MKFNWAKAICENHDLICMACNKFATGRIYDFEDYYQECCLALPQIYKSFHQTNSIKIAKWEPYLYKSLFFNLSKLNKKGIYLYGIKPVSERNTSFNIANDIKTLLNSEESQILDYFLLDDTIVSMSRKLDYPYETMRRKFHNLFVKLKEIY